MRPTRAGRDTRGCHIAMLRIGCVACSSCQSLRAELPSLTMPAAFRLWAKACSSRVNLQAESPRLSLFGDRASRSVASWAAASRRSKRHPARALAATTQAKTPRARRIARDLFRSGTSRSAPV